MAEWTLEDEEKLVEMQTRKQQADAAAKPLIEQMLLNTERNGHAVTH